MRIIPWDLGQGRGRGDPTGPTARVSAQPLLPSYLSVVLFLSLFAKPTTTNE